MNDRQKPGRNSCQATDIFFDRRLTYLLDFLLPITHQHDRWIGGFHHIGPKRGIRNHNGRQITVLAMAITFRNLATPPQSQSLSTKYLCFRIEPVKNSDDIFSPSEMTIFKYRRTYRDELTFGIGSPRRFGEPFDLFGPKQIILPFHSPQDQIPDVFIMDDRQTFPVLFGSQNSVEVIFPTIFGVCCQS